MSYVSLGYLLLFKSSGYCCYGNLLKWHANCTFFIIVTLFETSFFGGGRGGGQNGPTHALYNKLRYDFKLTHLKVQMQSILLFL